MEIAPDGQHIAMNVNRIGNNMDFFIAFLPVKAYIWA
jgi:hypothetical protein